MKPVISSINRSRATHGLARLVKHSAWMSKTFILLCTVTLLSAQALFAGAKETEATTRLKEALNKEFAGASEVKWYSDDDKTYMAKFTLREHKVTAYFDASGNLLATRRYINEEQLPLPVLTKLAKRYPGQQVRWVVEFDAEGSTVYYITLEGASTWKVIKSDANGGMSVHQNLKKI